MGEESNKRGVTDCKSQTRTPPIEKNAEALLIFSFERKVEGGRGVLVFQTVGNEQRPSLNVKKEWLNLNSLYNALDLRIGQKYSKHYACLQVKSKHQNTRGILQEYASEIERLTE
ncbi:hypothetical protein TNCV_706201 [Trichonephila clavipes]|nr:hypothetical protein TNCV_706201 [Trichonephila clavipes]